MVNLPVEYSDKAVTAFGGMRLMKEFLDKTGILDFLRGLDLPEGGSNRAYDSAKLIEAFMLNIWVGASRFCHCDWIRHDSVLMEIFGVSSLPSQSTYSRFFGKFSQARNARVFPDIQYELLRSVDTGALTIDFDSTVITRNGSQEGSVRGYNPNRRGRNSHHPLMAFISQTRMVANAWLRPGNTGVVSNCESFMDETFHILRDHPIGLVRDDSGFHSEKILSHLESKGVSYIIAAKVYPTIKHEIYGLKQWIRICDGIEVAEFEYQAIKGRMRRHIVVRKLIERRPEACGKMLFEDMPEYRFSCYVTNMTLPVDQLWNIYNGRADCENRIKELKSDFGLDCFCLQDFWATEASFRFIILAYNLMAMFRHVALNHHKTATLKTVRSYCFALGAWTSSHANKRTLKIALPKKKRPWMDAIFENIKAAAPPFIRSIA
jgi:hypothetical protein